jgi:hypothetical protein
MKNIQKSFRNIDKKLAKLEEAKKMKTNEYLIDVPVIQIDNRQIVLLAHF